MAGNEYSVTGSKAVIYKNGTPIWLTTLAPSANAWGGIAISGTDVYAGGNGYNAAGTSIATYWKNGNEFNLGDGLTSTQVRDLLVFNADLYVCGAITGSSGTVLASWWKNGVRNSVNNTDQTTIATSIFVK